MTVTETVKAGRIATHDEAVAKATEFAAQFAPGAPERDRSGRFPRAELRELAQSGLLAIRVPKEYGGPGLGVETVVEVVRILSAADPAIGQLTLPQFVLSFFLNLLASEELQSRIWPQMLEGARFGNATQPNKRPGAKQGPTLSTRIDEDTVRVDGGEKYYTTGSVDADFIAIATLDENGEALTVLVPGDVDGLTVNEDDWNSFGQRATVSGSVKIDGIVAPAANTWNSQVMFTTPNLFPAVDQILHASVDVGIARAALADAAWFIKERANPARESGLENAAEDPHTLYRLGQLRTHLDALEALTRENARIIDRVERGGELTPEGLRDAAAAGNEVKVFSNDVGIEIADTLFELTSTSGTDQRYGFDRHWRNLRVHSVNVATRWRYHQIGEATLSDLPASSPTRAHLEAAES
jgi:alkylation response protein AidB-like acyl-CoA dehydrogenase